MRQWFIHLFSEDWQPFITYITGAAHQAFFASFGLIILVTFISAVFALLFGMAGVAGVRARNPVLSSLGRGYMNMVRGIPDLLFFMFFPLALDLAIKAGRTLVLCPDGTALFDGINFVGCPASFYIASPTSAFAVVYYFLVACLSFGLVFGAFVTNVLRGVFDAIPRAQIETAEAYGFSPGAIFWRIQMRQVWVYAWGGLTNIWVLIIKATSLLSLLSMQEAVWWIATKLGPPQVYARVGYAHPDWTAYYLFILALFYLAFTWASETVFARAYGPLSKGMVRKG